ncbi:MAG TPA: V-type ATP synthase subunit F [Patescibacteria group bacterium]|nr:V-type ATP synthase subunit F [Patescibacteria group bacterium]
MSGTKVAVVGDTTSVAGFRPLGFAVYALEVPTQAREVWPELSSGAYGVVLLTEEVLGAVGDLVRELGATPLPAVTVIPGAGGEGGLGQARLDQAIVRALGTRAFIRDEDN